MNETAERRLTRLLDAGQRGLLKAGLMGLEKETLRVNRDGRIAQTPHPPALGSALTHPYVTTDYSEALLEFITPPFSELREVLRFLCDVHRFVYPRLEDEILWATSMPCVVEGEAGVPIAWYGRSNVGMMKHVYRQGLGHRYGKTMQVIAGVHFNYSLPARLWPVLQDLEQDDRPLRDFTDDGYFGLIRNLQRFAWLLLYLFGASPAVCKSFFGDRPTALAELDRGTYYQPYATSLRMSDIGYKNRPMAGVAISYRSLDDYVAGLTRAIETHHPDYERIGVKVGDTYRQLNANVLQIEAEYYSSVRPKRVPIGDEKPSLALKRRGVEYVEVRVLDVDAFDPMGCNEDELRFLEAFLLFCLLCDSPPVGEAERKAIEHNQLLTAGRGRDPEVRLQQGERSRTLRDWAAEVCQAMEGVCEALDGDGPERPYARALAVQKEAVRDAERTPSARMLAELRRTRETFYGFAMRVSEQHRAFFEAQPLDAGRTRFFEEQARQSLARQKDLERADDLPFDEFLRRYFAQGR